MTKQLILAIGIIDPLAPFGIRYFLLPNPMDGSWQ